MRMSRAFFVVLAATLPAAVAIINAGAVVLRPCGVLEMEASWVDSPKDGASYVTTLPALLAKQLCVLCRV